MNAQADLGGAPQNRTAPDTQGRMDAELMQAAAETARTAFVRAQALAVAAEHLFTAILRVRDGGAGGDVPALKTAATALGNMTRESDHALREAMEGTDRLLDALGADAGARVLERGRSNAGTGAREGAAHTKDKR
jgi:hypothetical protein